MNTRNIELALGQIEAKNYAAALAVLEPLAEQGDPEAICNLATLYQCGLGVEMNGEKAVALYLRVASLNVRERCLSGIAYHNLSTIFRTGLPGVQANLEKAEAYDALAKELGFPM